MRVLHVLPIISARAGGPVAFAVDAAEALAQIGVESTLLSTSLGNSPTAGSRRRVEPHEMPANLDRLDLHLFDVKPPRRLAFSPSLARRLDRIVGDYDLVHVHSLWLFPQYAAQWAARSAGIPYVVSPHGALDPYLRARGRGRKALTDALWQNRMLDDAALLHVTTAEEGQLIADVAPHVGRATVPVGVWVDRLRVGGDAFAFRREHLRGREHPLVLFLGRLTFKKGVDILIRAFAHAQRQYPDALLAIAGPDDEGLRPSLEAIARTEGVADRVIFTGPLYGTDRANAFAAASIWALSSHTENFGVAVMESLAVGLPTVVSPEVNLASVIEEDAAGVVAGLAPAEFGAALAALLGDPEGRAEMGRRARKLAERYDWANVAPDLAAMYESAASRAQ